MRRPPPTPTARALSPAGPPDAELDALAAAAGRAWATGLVDGLRAEARPIIGGWPGTLREARGQVAVALSAHRGRALTTERLDALARTAYVTARHEWSARAEPDPEP